MRSFATVKSDKRLRIGLSRDNIELLVYELKELNKTLCMKAGEVKSDALFLLLYTHPF